MTGGSTLGLIEDIFEFLVVETRAAAFHVSARSYGRDTVG
jgi:hypothetical protein